MDQLYFNAGGGIVWDSDVDAEYKECFDKAAGYVEIIQSGRTRLTHNRCQAGRQFDAQLVN